MVSHLPEEENPASPWEDARGMDVSRCSGTRLGARDRLVLLLKCHHPLCTCLERGDVSKLPTMVKTPAPVRTNKDLFPFALVHAWRLPERF